jgi:hypothetical protein
MSKHYGKKRKGGIIGVWFAVLAVIALAGAVGWVSKGFADWNISGWFDGSEAGSAGLQGGQGSQGDYSVRFMYRDAETGKEKIAERFCGAGGSVAPPSDVGDVAQTADNPALTLVIIVGNVAAVCLV